ncbi:heme binding [Mucor velutinosus]|uniref:Heme binding n=1 Tax=Mucor velutinosus TaxID=708070 RepID=A0AAN7I479_9FUNG|nr:heme binding [Mucor velutinosus]
MSHTPMDLDSSLDDLIKKRKSSGSDRSRSRKHSNNKSKKQQQQHQMSSRPALQTSKAKVSKPTPPRSNSGINARLSTSSGNSPSGPLFTAKNTPPAKRTTPKADPSQIIITKAIPTSNAISNRIGSGAGNDKKMKSVIASRLGSQPRQQQQQQPQIQSQILRPLPATQQQQLYMPSSSIQSSRDPIQIRGMYQPEYVEPGQGISIRGRSNTATARPGISIRGESGPTTVLMTGLDAYANSDDVRLAVEDFGNVLSCEVLRDRQGRSFGEAEIEFSSKDAALDCIAALDNKLADGRILRIILREPKKPQTYAQKQLRSMVQPSYAVSGKMYSDQLTPRYDIYRQ